MPVKKPPVKKPPPDRGDFEKTLMGSKKFVAYLVAEATWKAALILVIVLGMKNGLIDHIVGGLALAITIVAGFIETGYILGQASLDKYTRIAEIAVGGGQKIMMNGKGKVEVVGQPPQPTEDPEDAPPPESAG